MNKFLSIFIYIIILLISIVAFVSSLFGLKYIWLYIAIIFILTIISRKITIKEWDNYTNWIKFKSSSKRSSELKKYPFYIRNAASYVIQILKKQQQKQNKRNERLEMLLKAMDKSPNGIIILDSQMKIKWLNSITSKLLQLDPQRDLLQYITNLIRKPKFVEYINKKEFDTELKYNTDDNKRLSISLSPYDQSNYLLNIIDTTKQYQLERTKRDFIADVSYELKNPLMILDSFLEVQTTLPLTKEEHDKHMFLMNKEVKKMNNIIDDLLFLTKLENSEPAAIDNRLDLNSLLEKLVSKFNTKHQINIINDLSIDIIGEKKEIVTAINNLIYNAIAYTDESLPIDIVSNINDNKELEISVIDNGDGIDPKKIQFLTKRFYRIDKTRSRRTGGTGLGLSIVKHVMTRHNGRLDISSILGKGSTFKLVFPQERYILNTKNDILDIKTE